MYEKLATNFKSHHSRIPTLGKAVSMTRSLNTSSTRTKPHTASPCVIASERIKDPPPPTKSPFHGRPDGADTVNLCRRAIPKHVPSSGLYCSKPIGTAPTTTAARALTRQRQGPELQHFLILQDDGGKVQEVHDNREEIDEVMRPLSKRRSLANGGAVRPPDAGPSNGGLSDRRRSTPFLIVVDRTVSSRNEKTTHLRKARSQTLSARTRGKPFRCRWGKPSWAVAPI